MKLTPAYLSSTIENAMEAKSISLRTKGITHIDDISYCVNLNRIDLSDNDIKSGEALSGLRYCKGITWISVAKNHLTDITNLSHLKGLQVLNASYNELSELPWDQLIELSSLKALILNNNNLVKFPLTAKLPKSVDTIVLSNNPLVELPSDMFKSLTYLTKLSSSHTQLHQVPDLSQCLDLKEVRLASNKISSLSGIDKLIPLTVEIIDIGHNLIRKRSELDRLFSFKKLTSLNIRGNLSDDAADEDFLQVARKQLPDLKIFNGRNLTPSTSRKNKKMEFRLKPERQNRNTKVTFEE